MLGEEISEATVKACDKLLTGSFRNDHVVDPIQGGAGTSLNMNASEFIADRAVELLGGRKGGYSVIHPNDHVNLCQSANEVIPTAGKMTAVQLLGTLLIQLALSRTASDNSQKKPIIRGFPPSGAFVCLMTEILLFMYAGTYQRFVQKRGRSYDFAVNGRVEYTILPVKTGYAFLFVLAIDKLRSVMCCSSSMVAIPLNNF